MEFNHKLLRQLIAAAKSLPEIRENEMLSGGYFCYAQANRDFTGIIVPRFEIVGFPSTISLQKQYALMADAFNDFMAAMDAGTKGKPMSRQGIFNRMDNQTYIACGFAGFTPQINQAVCLIACAIENNESYSGTDHLLSEVMQAMDKLCPDNPQVRPLVENYLKASA